MYKNDVFKKQLWYLAKYQLAAKQFSGKCSIFSFSPGIFFFVVFFEMNLWVFFFKAHGHL